jgi:methylenetetrahydrofolate dehydrogenase (NADP+)/methenyltetrahydrofolate cyclohydrolase
LGTILDGKRLAEEIKSEVKKDVETLNKLGIAVGISLLLVGDNPASKQYFKNIVGSCRQVGLTAYEYKLPATATVNEILNVVQSINADERISGLLILMPLPAHMNARRVINAMVAEKDVDGLGAISVGRLAADESTFQLFKGGRGDAPVFQSASLDRELSALHSVWSHTAA